jgi:hypothetical protein
MPGLTPKQAVAAAAVLVLLAIAVCLLGVIGVFAYLRPKLDVSKLEFGPGTTIDPATGIIKRDETQAADVTVVAKSGKGGTIDSLIVKSSVEEKEVADLKALEKYLKSIRPKVHNQVDLKMEADSKLKYAGVIEVMDAAIRAGFERVSFSPPADLAKDQ